MVELKEEQEILELMKHLERSILEQYEIDKKQKLEKLQSLSQSISAQKQIYLSIAPHSQLKDDEEDLEEHQIQENFNEKISNMDSSFTISPLYQGASNALITSKEKCNLLIHQTVASLDLLDEKIKEKENLLKDWIQKVNGIKLRFKTYGKMMNHGIALPEVEQYIKDKVNDQDK